MSDNSGSSGILGVIVGVMIVLGIGVFFLNGGLNGGTKNIDVNLKAPVAAPK